MLIMEEVEQHPIQALAWDNKIFVHISNIP